MKGEDRRNETTTPPGSEVVARAADDRELAERTTRLVAAMLASKDRALAEKVSRLAAVANAANDPELVEAVSRLVAEEYYRAFLTHSLRVPLNQVQKRVARIERMLELSSR